MDFDVFVKYLLSLLDYYTVAAVVMTAWTFCAWLFSWVFPQRHISFWLGAHFIWALTGREQGRRNPVLLRDFLVTLGLGFIPIVNVFILAFLIFGNVFFFIRGAFNYRKFCG